jgi:hypothetical protein
MLHPPNPPGRHPQLGNSIVDLVRRRQAPSCVRDLIAAYLDRFAADDSDIVRLGGELQTLVHETRWRANDEWPARAAKFGLFDPTEAPKRIADAILSSERPPGETLVEAGLDSEFRLRGGLSEAAFRRACARCAVAPASKAVATQVRLVDWARDSHGALAFVRAWPALFHALMTPWSKVEPPAHHKAQLTSLALEWGGGDPRLGRGRAWTNIRKDKDTAEAFATLMRWLTRASVMQFLEIVDNSLDQASDRRMWSYRRAFWTAYLLGEDGGHKIDEAWIAFGQDAVDRARAASKRTGDRSFEAFGIQHERSAQHSALIMKIGDMIIVDWSHNGKCQFWHRNAKGAPSLYQPEYPTGLYTAPHKETHSAPATYSWQKKFAQIIEGRHFYTERASWRPKGV